MLDMGEQVRIEDIARRMIAASGKALDIVYTGLRRGEKLHDDSVADDEDDVRPFHPLISHVSVRPVAPDELVLQPWARSIFGPLRHRPAATELRFGSP